MNPLGALLLVLSLGSFLVFVFMAIRARRERNSGLAGKRLRRLGDRLAGGKAGAPELSILRHSKDRPGSDSSFIINRLPIRVLEQLELLLYRAGSETGVGRLLLLCASLGGLLFALGIRFFFDFGIASAMGTVAFGLPLAVFRFRARGRVSEFEAALPEALALLGRSLRGGHALQRSFRIVADEMSGIISQEFALVGDELSLGRDMAPVLQGLSRRIGLPDIELFAGGVLLQREYGGNLAEVVDKLALMIRERFKFQAKVLAMTSTNRNSAMMLLVIPFAFVALMYFSNPDFIEPLWTTSEGESLGTVALVLAFSGYGLARRVAKVEA